MEGVPRDPGQAQGAAVSGPSSLPPLLSARSKQHGASHTNRALSFHSRACLLPPPAHSGCQGSTSPLCPGCAIATRSLHRKDFFQGKLKEGRGGPALSTPVPACLGREGRKCVQNQCQAIHGATHLVLSPDYIPLEGRHTIQPSAGQRPKSLHDGGRCLPSLGLSGFPIRGTMNICWSLNPQDLFSNITPIGGSGSRMRPPLPP